MVGSHPRRGPEVPQCRQPPAYHAGHEPLTSERVPFHDHEIHARIIPDGRCRAPASADPRAGPPPVYPSPRARRGSCHVRPRTCTVETRESCQDSPVVPGPPSLIPSKAGGVNSGHGPGTAKTAPYLSRCPPTAAAGRLPSGHPELSTVIFATLAASPAVRGAPDRTV